VNWLNARLARSAVKFDKLDQHLSALGMSCQLLCQDTSESIEVASNQLVTQLPGAGRELERMRGEATRGRGQLGDVLEGLRDADDRKCSRLQGLSEIDSVKTRVEMARGALREVGSWERKVRDCEQMAAAGNLPAALSQLTSLRDVLDAFRMLPEYPKKEEQLAGLGETLLGSARKKARQAVERGAADDVRSCCEVFTGLQKTNELAFIVNNVFVELTQKALQGAGEDIAGAVRVLTEMLPRSLEDKWPILQSLEPEGAPGVNGIAISAIRAALGTLSHQVDECLGSAGHNINAAGEEASAVTRASRALALLAAYVDGFEALAHCSPLTQSPNLWRNVCKEAEGSEILPWSLLSEIVLLVMLRPMQDDATALVPHVSGQMRPSEAVLSAESNAKRLLQLPTTWARRLEQQGATQLTASWLACVDEACTGFWRRWDTLIDTFQNTLAARSGTQAADSPYDPSLLNECMQLHSILHDALPTHFAASRAEVFQLATRMYTANKSPFGWALSEKLSDSAKWCNRVGIPSVAALQGAQTALESSPPDMSQVLPESAKALAAAETKVRGLVTQCCVKPVSNILSTYQEGSHWSRNSDEPLEAGSLLPLQCVTAVGEHLFSLVPQLERSQDSCQFQWLPTILEAVVEAVVQKVMQIKTLSIVGAQQLAVDLEYFQKVTDALGNSEESGGTAGSQQQLPELLEALNFLIAQQKRKLECATKGVTFSEEAREGAPLSRRFERMLRAALGLDRAV